MPVELIIVRDIWCRHYYFRRGYCRSNSCSKKLFVDLSTVDLSDVGANTLELTNVDTNIELILDLNLLTHWMVTLRSTLTDIPERSLFSILAKATDFYTVLYILCGFLSSSARLSSLLT